MCDRAGWWRQLQAFPTLVLLALPGQVSGVGAEVTEHRSSAVTLRSRVMLVFNACVRNGPSSVPAFSSQ